jgi:hypothetical protein
LPPRFAEHLNLLWRGVVESTAGLYGDLQGIAGRSLLKIDGLELPLLDGPPRAMLPNDGLDSNIDTDPPPKADFRIWSMFPCATQPLLSLRIRRCRHIAWTG